MEVKHMANTYKGLKSTVTGETMIFRNDKGKFPRYSTSFSQKVKDSDEWENGWMDVQFKRDVALIDNKTKINITDGWLKFNISDGKTYWKIFVNAFDLVDGEKYEGFAAVTDEEDSVPF
jgi:hypothetical protein